MRRAVCIVALATVWSLTGAVSCPAASPTVLILPGGGFQAHSNMESWQQDFKAHHIHSRVVKYPLGNILTGIRAVRKEANSVKGPVVLYGYSAGGTIAAALAATGEVDGAVVLTAPLNLQTWHEGWHILDQIKISEADKVTASPFWRLKGRTSPQLVQCGLADIYVNCSQAMEYVDRVVHPFYGVTGQPDTTINQMPGGHVQSSKYRRVARNWITRRWN